MDSINIFSFSDIHIDINSHYMKDNTNFIEEFRKYVSKLENIDIVVCAGDISSKISEIVEFLTVVSENMDAKWFVFVPGNHDIWEVEKKVNDGISRIKYEDLIPQAIKGSGFHYLPEKPLTIENEVALIGSIGWYDYSFRNKKWDCYLKENKLLYEDKSLDGLVWNDLIYSGWGMDDLGVVEYSLKNLDESYSNIQNIPNKIAVLHHIPFKEGVVYKDELSWDFFSAYMGSKVYGERLLNWNFDLVVHGHTHFSNTYTIKNTQVICPAIGYQHEWQEKNLQKMFERKTRVHKYVLQ